MASRITKKFKPFEFIFLFIVFLVFILVLGKYLYPPIVNYVNVTRAQEALSVKLLPTTSCSPGQVEIKHGDGILCRDNVPTSTLTDIFDNYPLNPNGKDELFSFDNTNDASQTIEIANEYLNNYYYVDRYAPVQIDSLTWTEDPYSQQYWRFIFYSLRPTEYLLYAWERTGNPAYKDKFIEIIQSFLTIGVNQPDAWNDPHAVAFRTMVLVDAWWNLREYNALPVELSNEILLSLEQHGNYLADPNHYEPVYNHAINEAGALFLLSVNFPDLTGASTWKTISEDRLTTSLNTAVDSDGVLLENSSYYHFYVLEKYWEIFKYAQTQGITFGSDAQDKLQQMISYATYILQPNDEVPLLGASIERKVNFAGVDKDIALANPNLMYVLTQGQKGTQPSQLSVHYSTAGETVMRSGWGSGTDFVNQTQLIFNVGPFRTNHSQLDALAFTLYGQGAALMPGAGLYTYASGTYKDYFWGTSSHNTVVVDGGDQSEGTAIAGTFEQGNGYTYQTGESSLYNGVTHDRAIALLGQNLVLIVDHLKSSDQHVYDQMFHLFPGAQLAQSGLDITGYDPNNANQQITVHQLITTGVTVTSTINQSSPISGVCSEQYGQLIPCYSLSYQQTGQDAEFVTVLEIGKPDPNLQMQLSSDDSQVSISDEGKNYTVNVGDVPADVQPVQILNNNPIAMGTADSVSGFTQLSSWQKINQLSNDNGILTADNSLGEPALILTSPTDGTWVEEQRDLPLDLSDKNMEIRVNVKNAADVKDLEVRLSTDDWTGYATMRFDNAYPITYSGQWVDVTLGKGELREVGGEWTIGGSGFDWSKIDKIAFQIESSPGTTATLGVGDFSLIPAQSQGTVVVVFDNGYDSILPAAQVMQNLGLKGNVGAISGYISKSGAGHLTLAELQNLQNQYGWNIINESYYHYNPITQYYETNNLAGLDQDILKGAEYLTDNGINSDPNWYIYPDGITNDAIKAVVSKYYKFARTTTAAPEVYPFGDPLGVKTFSTITNDTDPESVIKAIYDAQKYNLTLFLTFRQIQSLPSDPPGYPLADFQEIMQYVAQNKVDVETFSELDQSNGVSINVMKLASNQPEQLSFEVETHNNIFREIMAFLSEKIQQIHDIKL